MVELMKTMATSFQRSHACTTTFSAPNPAAGHRWPMPSPETPRHPQASISQSLVRSPLLSSSPGAQGSVCALPESVSPFCVRSGGSMVG